jgi:hypothetical protein
MLAFCCILTVAVGHVGVDVHGDGGKELDDGADVDVDGLAPVGSDGGTRVRCGGTEQW